MRLPSDERLRGELAGALQAIGETPLPSIIESLCSHLRLLAGWNERYHLTTVTSWPEILDRHLKESLLPLRWIGPAGRLIDIGSGNGYPGIPILACRPGLEGWLAERSEKKSLFLAEALRLAHLPRARVLTADLGAPGARAQAERFDYVISRATLPPEEYLALAASLVAPGGRVFMYAGSEGAPAEVGALIEGASGVAANVNVGGTQSPLRLLAREPIAGRRDSFLFVFQA